MTMREVAHIGGRHSPMDRRARENVSGSSVSEATGTSRLTGRWLLTVRVAWVLLAGWYLISLVQSFTAYLAGIEHPSPDNAVLSPAVVSALARAGISLDAYAKASLALACAVVLVAVAMAVVLNVRRGDDWMVLLVSLFLVVYITTNVGFPSANNAPTSSPDTLLNLAGAVLQNLSAVAIVFGVFLLFPNGQFVPRWSLALYIVTLAWAVAIGAEPTLFAGALFLGYPIFISATIVCILYRYRRASTPMQQMQTKWVVTGIVGTLVANQAFWLPTGFTPLGQTLYPPVAFLAYQLALLLLPVTFFIAIQRYRLYEIDTILNRTLVYGSLTAILAAIYLAGVIGTQSLVGAFTHNTGSDQPVIVVATTLLIAALFRPLRAQLQAIVDRRFYRRKYDAARTLAGFSGTLRQELDLATLRENLLAAIDETMQPAHASLWLRDKPTLPVHRHLPSPEGDRHPGGGNGTPATNHP